MRILKERFHVPTSEKSWENLGSFVEIEGYTYSHTDVLEEYGWGPIDVVH